MFCDGFHVPDRANNGAPGGKPGNLLRGKASAHKNERRKATVAI